MSLGVSALETINAVAPRSRWSEVRKFAIISGPSLSNFQTWNSSSYSANNIAWSCPPPSLQIGVARKVICSIDYHLIFAGTNTGTGTLLNLGSTDGVRAQPTNSCISTLTATLNGNSVNIQMSDLVSPFSRVNTPEKEVLDGEYSLGPVMPDQDQVYTSGSNRDPLAPYGSNSFLMTRGGWANAVPTLNAGGGGPASLVGYPSGGVYLPPVATITGPGNVAGLATGEAFFTDCFELQLSPFAFAQPDASGFIGLSAVDIQMTFNDLSRLWSRNQVLAATAPYLNSITSITASVNGARLTFLYDAPQATTPIPPSVIYPYELPSRYTTAISTPFTPDMVQSIVSNTVTLPSIPKRMMVWVRRSNATQNWTTTDTFLSIEKVNINFLSNSGILNSAEQHSLYLMSRKNGLNLSFAQFSNYVGSVFIADFGVDLALPDPSLAPSVSEQSQLQITVQAHNRSSQTIVATLFMCFFLDGTCTLRDASMFLSTSVVSRRDVLEVRNKPQVEYDVGQSRYGGDFFSSIKSLLPAARSLIESHPIGAAASHAAKSLLCDEDGREAPMRRKKHKSSRSIISRRSRP